jgi:Secretion system C-terminal sorting domain
LDTFNKNKYGSDGSKSEICDNNGQTLFWTNGYVVLDRNYDTLPNGTNFNHSLHDDLYINALGGSPLSKGCIIIPIPKNANQFLMFYMNLEYTDPQGGSYLPSKLSCLLIDKSLQGGLGDVVFKDSTIIADSLMDGNVFAIKHGNGAAWWVIVRKFRSNLFYKVLVDSNGIHSPISQSIGTAFTAPYITSGPSDVSDNGDKLAYVYNLYSAPMGVTNPTLQIDIIDFNRCNGLLSNPMNMAYTYLPDTLRFWSCCFSPNGKLFYAAMDKKLYQFNLDSANIFHTRKLIQRYNGSACPTAAWFWHMKRGLDSKIYVSVYGGVNCMHVINNPDVAGLGCNFVQNQLLIPLYHVFDVGLPNTPNYTLGAVNCTTGMEELATKDEAINIYPNPATNQLTIVSNQLAGNTIEVLDVLGRVMLKSKAFAANCQLNTTNLQSGFYFLKITDEKGNSSTKKFVKE